jgi:epoxyqueuosine reductase
VKQLSLSEWQEKYFVGSMRRFDQKYQMFNRPHWDPTIRHLLEDWGFSGESKEKPGYTLRDLALQQAAWAGTSIAFFNTSKPNSPPRGPMAGMMGSQRTTPGHGVGARGNQKMEVGDPNIMARDIKNVARYFGADVVGICRLDNLWVYSHTYEAPRPGAEATDRPVTCESKAQEIPAHYRYVVVMGFAENYEIIKYYPTHVSEAPVGLGYSRMAVTNAHVASFIRNIGHEAIDCSINDVALSIPLAMQAGLGDLGRNGLLISPQFGARLRLSKVITDLPLVPDAPIEFGVAEFCASCKKCADRCPSRSISFGDTTTEPINVSNAGGARKWRINAETCRTYWSRVNHGCNNCVACCPYTKPDTWPHRTALWFTDHVRWADPLYVRMDDLFGYGKPKKADDFWDTWEPGER